MGTMNPKITVLMPVYNGEQYLAEAIESIITQTYENFELLIINDGSKDRSVEIIQSYNDSRIRLINNEQNMGLVATLNKGIDLSQGEYIARMDQDDISLPNRLAVQVDYLESHSKVGICGSWIEVFGLGNYVEKYPTNYEEIKVSLLFNNVLAHPTVMMRKRMFDHFHLRYSIEFLHAEDYELWQRCSTYFEIVNIGQVLLKYRTSMTSYCRIFTIEQAATLQRIDKRNMKLLGLAVSPKTIGLQKKLRDMQFSVSKEFVTQVAEWFKILVAANIKTSCYDSKEFLRIIGTYWFKICIHNCELGIWMWWHFIISPFGGSYQTKLINSLYLFNRCCRQEIKRRFRYLRGMKT